MINRQMNKVFLLFRFHGIARSGFNEDWGGGGGNNIHESRNWFWIFFSGFDFFFLFDLKLDTDNCKNKQNGRSTSLQ